MQKERIGLIKLRVKGKGTDKPTLHCSNCNCTRFSVCGCLVVKGKTKEVTNVKEAKESKTT